MNNSNTFSPTSHYSPRAGLVALGLKIVQLDPLSPLRKHFKLNQKTVKFSPFHKLLTALVAIMAGACGLVEINKLVRADPALFKAFGRWGCPDQSGVQTTLSECTPQNVWQVQQAFKEL